MTNQGKSWLTAFALMAVAAVGYYYIVMMGSRNTEDKFVQQEQELNQKVAADENIATAVLAGGCFWCIEKDLEKLDGVVDVISGYSGGDLQNPSYDNYARGGHREVVKVFYDENKLSYEKLLHYFISHIDPTDPDGMFVDRGKQYSSAIYVANEEKRQIAKDVLRKIEEAEIYDKPLAVPILDQKKFWSAEDYHQDYYKKSPLKYRFYRAMSGRNAFIEKHLE